jgi:hypothetical protein
LETWQSPHGKTANRAKAATELYICLLQTLTLSQCWQEYLKQKNKNEKQKRRKMLEGNMEKKETRKSLSG